MRWWLLLLCLALAVGARDLIHVTPGQGETVSSGRPVITVNIPKGSAIPYDMARIWVNGKEVSGLLRTPMFVSYQPAGELPEGKVEVKFAAGNTTLNWDFSIKFRQSITSVTHDAVDNLGEYDELHVVMKGEPGGKAWFDLDGLADKVPLEEAESGTYKGTLLIEPGSNRMGSKLTASLRLGPRTTQLASEKPVNVFGGLFRVKIFGPPSGSKVESTFSLTGRTRPGSKVICAPNLGIADGMSAPVTDTNIAGRRSNPTTGSVETTADDKGYFTVEYGVPIVLPNLQVAMAVYAIDPQGNRSAPVILRYRFD